MVSPEPELVMPPIILDRGLPRGRVSGSLAPDETSETIWSGRHLTIEFTCILQHSEKMTGETICVF